MPVLKIQTNITLDAGEQQKLLARASLQIAKSLGKPERYVLVLIEPQTPMLFAGENGPLAYLELKSIGLKENQTTELSAMLCELLSGYGIPADRVYIEFSNAQASMWGWNSTTF